MGTQKFELYCLVELMGHQRIAGLCTEQVIAGANMLRVDVPKTENAQAFTRFYSPSAVYAIHPIDKGTAEAMAGKLNQAPITTWDINEIINKQPAALPVGAADDDIGF